MPLKPRTKVSTLDLPTLGGGRFDLAARQRQSFTMLSFIADCTARFARPISATSTASWRTSRRAASRSLRSAPTRRNALSGRERIGGIEHLSIAYDLSTDQAWHGGSIFLYFKVNQRGGAAAIRRAGPFPDPSRRHAVLRLGPDHAVRAAVILRGPAGGRVRRREELSGAWRSVATNGDCRPQKRASSFERLRELKNERNPSERHSRLCLRRVRYAVRLCLGHGGLPRQTQ